MSSCFPFNLAHRLRRAANVMSLAGASALQAAPALQWDELAPLPPAPGETVQAGLAGPYSGEHNAALLVADADPLPLARTAVAGALNVDGRWVLAHL